MRDSGMTGRLVDALHGEAMALADAARAYADTAGRAERDGLPPLARIAFTCELMKVTTRLTYIIAWLLTRRALIAGEIGPREARDSSRRLGLVEATDPAVSAGLPVEARELVAASEALHMRVARLEAHLAAPPAGTSPAHQLIARLENAF